MKSIEKRPTYRTHDEGEGPDPVRQKERISWVKSGLKGQLFERSWLFVSTFLKRRPRTALLLLAALVAATVAIVSAAAAGTTFTVNSTNDTNTCDATECTLRGAINAANNSSGPDLIKFDIPGSGVKTIALDSDYLPTITDPVTIDGYTQPGASANTNPLSGGSNAVPLIELTGNLSGLTIDADDSTIRGLVINRVASSDISRSVGTAITINGSDNVVEGNFVGTNPAGTAMKDTYGFQFGIITGDKFTSSGANDNIIGGTTPAARNVVSGNRSQGIFVKGSNGTVIQGNYIGTNAAGTAAVESRFDAGITVLGQPFAGGASFTNTTIGGAAAGAGNLISGNGSTGIHISSNVGSIQGNLIGTQRDGVSPLGNGGSAIHIGAGSNWTIGGLAPGEANTMANNGEGVRIAGPSFSDGPSDNNNISGNSIHSNGGLGINLTDGSSGLVTFNDPGDTDRGPNQEQNFPVLTSAPVSGGNATVSGTLNSTANTTFRLEFFSNERCDPPNTLQVPNIPGHGEGQTYIGTTNVTTDGSGNASFGPLSFPVPSGQSVITATATAPHTDPNNPNLTNTSEFSKCLIAPTAKEDSYSTDQDQPLSVPAPGVLGNDTDPDKDTLTATVADAPAHGDLTLQPDGSFAYTPDAGFSGEDTFTYKANDGTYDSEAATVTITVKGDPPPELTAYADQESFEGQDQTFILGYLYDPGSGAPWHISVDWGDGSSVETFDTDYGESYLLQRHTYATKGTYDVTVTVTEGDANPSSDTATFRVEVSLAPPQTVGDTYYVDEDRTLTVDAPGVLGNDVDPQGDVLTAEIYDDPSSPYLGTLDLRADGSFTYTPNADFSMGADYAYYRACDPGGSCSDWTYIEFINEGPAVNDDAASTDEDSPVVVDVLENDEAFFYGRGSLDPSSVRVVTQPLHGSATVDSADGRITYSPNSDYNGADEFTYEVCDEGTPPKCDTATAKVTVNPVNDRPDAKDDTATTDVNTALTIKASDLLKNDTDIDKDPLSLKSFDASSAEGGTIVDNNDGTLKYTPKADFNGSDSFTYKATDGTADSNSATVTITVDAVNDAPEAKDDSYSVDEDAMLEVSVPGVLENDADTENDALTAVKVSEPANGTLELNSDGSFTYAPKKDFSGSDSFTYTASDGSTESGAATVSITVNPANDTPAAKDDSYATDEDQALSADASEGVLTNDTDVDKDALKATVVDQPTHGTLDLKEDGSFTYTPEKDYNGSDSFTYKASDGTSDSEKATVGITVNPVSDPPVAKDDAYKVDEDGTLSEAAPGVLANDADVDKDALKATVGEKPNHGTLDLKEDGSFTYTPEKDYNGSDSFTYKANDGTSDSNTATVTITVDAANDVPSAAGDSATTEEDTATSEIEVLANDKDADGDSLSVGTFTDGSHGTVSKSDDGKKLTYTPQKDFNGSDSFTYTASDGTAESGAATVSITVNPVNDTPAAKDDSYATDEDQALSADASEGVLTNDTDVDKDALKATVVDQPTHGTLDLKEDGSFTYTPEKDYNGSDSFTYKANDGQADSNTVTVTITVDAVNDAPVADNDSYSVDEDGTLDVSAPGVLENDTDAESGTLTAAKVSDPANGTLTLNSDGSFTYAPKKDFSGSDYFDYKANDGTSDSNTTTVTITVDAVNDPPAAKEDSYSSDEGQPLNVPVPGVLANDTDPESGTTLTAVKVSDPADGTLELKSDGSFTYTPDADFSGTDSFDYKASDGTSDSNTVTVTITVDAVNDAPVADNDSYSVDEDGTLDVSAPGVLENDTDAENDPLTAAKVSDPASGTLTLKSDGSFTYTPDADFSGTDSFTYKVNDGSVDSSPATVSIKVDALSDAPVAEDQAIGTQEDTAKAITLHASDADGDRLRYSVADPAHGTLSGTAPNLTYTPTKDYQGPDSFTFKANDGTSDSNIATVNITVNPVNDPPVAKGDSYGTDEDRTLSAATASGVLANDTDVDKDALKAVVADNPTHGTLALKEDGSFSYTPQTDYNGSDSFTYKANDGTLDSEKVTVSIAVKPVNDAPAAKDDSYSVEEDKTLSADALKGILANDTDVEKEGLTAKLATDVSHGTLDLKSDGSFTYTPEQDYNGGDSFTYKANDGTSDSNPARVSIEVKAATPSDATKPTITITTPANGATYAQKQDPQNPDVKADYKCQDEAGGSGIKSCVGPVANGAAIDTSSLGTKTFTVNAEDNAGNKTSLTHTYQVARGVPVDIKPPSCPNPLGMTETGTLPVSIAGTASFDVAKVDRASVKLEGVSQKSGSPAVLEDVATPFEPYTGKTKETDCTTKGRDGKKDLTVKFDAQAVIKALGPLADGQVKTLKVTGKLTDGTPIVGEDVVIIRRR